MDDGPQYPRDASKKPTKESWLRFKQWKKFLRSIPDKDPVLQPSIRSNDSSNVFVYRLNGINYEDLAGKWFKDRNVTYRRKFIDYLTQLYSPLISAELTEDGSVVKEQTGVELYSVDLKRNCRNYADFNLELGRHGFLDRLDLHESRGKKRKCTRYGVPLELLRKGIQKTYLTRSEKKRIEKAIRISEKPDQTPAKLDDLLRYFSKQLKRTAIPSRELSQLELELGTYRELYPKVIRHGEGKLDLKLGEKEGRLYSLYLNAPRLFRRILRWNGKHPMVEGDVAASHFHFLLKYFADAKERKGMIVDLQTSDPYLSMCGHPKEVRREDLKASSHQFKYGSRLKTYPRRRDNKWLEMRRRKRTILYREGLFFRNISKRYPRFADTMAKMRILGPNQKSKFACKIMRRESDVMVQMVGRKCMREKLVYLPIHDGFLTLPRHYDRVCEIVTESFLATTGSKPFIRRKNTPTPVKESR